MTTSDKAEVLLNSQVFAVTEAKRAINALTQLQIHVGELGYEAEEIKFMKGYLSMLISRVKHFDVDQTLF